MRVEFHGSSAKEVASSGICIGDEVVLGLENGGWEREEAGLRTPGNGVDWKLSYGEKLSMQVGYRAFQVFYHPVLQSDHGSKIRRDSHQLADMNIDCPSLCPKPTPTTIIPSGTPPSQTAAPSPAFKFIANSELSVWRSPAFLKRARTSSVSLFDSLYDAYAEESLDKPAKRSKIERVSGQWRYADLSNQDNGADSDLPVQWISEAVGIEAGLEPAIAGGTADSPPRPIGDLIEVDANELADSAAKAHPVRVEGTCSPETVRRQELLEDQSLLIPWTNAMPETTDSREGTTIDVTQDLSSVEGPLSGSNLPIYEGQSRRMYGESSNPDGSALHPTPTPIRTAKTETANPPLDEDVREAPVLPSSPLLHPTASTGLPLIPPIVGRLSMDSSVHEERQDQVSELNSDTLDGEFQSQSTPDPISAVPYQDDHTIRQSTGDDQDMGHNYLHLVSPAPSEQRKMLEGRSPNSGGSIIPHQKERDSSDGAFMPTDFIQERLDIPNIYARSSLQMQNMRPEPSTSVGSASESEIGDDDELSTEDFEGFTSEGISSEYNNRTESMAERESLEIASSEKEPSREAESDDEEIYPRAQHHLYNGRDAKTEDMELLSTQDPEIIDLEDDSEDESQPDTTSPEVQNIEKVFSSPFAVSSSSEDGSRPSEVDYDSSNAQSVNNDNTSEYITYPTLPEEGSEQPTPLYSPSPPQYNNTEAELDPRGGTQLLTPNATQLTHEERSNTIDLQYDGRDLPTPQLTQTTGAGQLSLEVADRLDDETLLRNELRSLTVPLEGVLGRRRSKVPDVISPWFTLKRSSQVYEASEEDDESDSQGEQSLDSEPLELFHPAVEPNNSSVSRFQISEPDTVATVANGNTPPLVGLRTPLSYFSPLATMHDHFTSTIDVLAIVTSTTPLQRSKSGPKDYYLTLNIIDPSSNSTLTTVQIFRPFKEALPVVSKGAAILLRNFKVQSQKHEFVLVSTACSAWAVFENGQSVQVNGPPVEIGAEERGFAKGLSQWWASLGQDVKGTIRE